MATIALVGNPNCGKTTLFNALTGSRQQVGNWPGVTVERKSGSFIHQGNLIEVIDLPGIYSLMVASETAAVDESLACDFILRGQAEVIVNIVDASNLERHLYLTMQLLEMGVPLFVVVNMMDVAEKRGLYLHLDSLSQMLGCPVLPLQANKGKGLMDLKNQLLKLVHQPSTAQSASHVKIPYAQPIPAIISEISSLIQASNYPFVLSRRVSAVSKDVLGSSQDKRLSPQWLALRLLEDDVYAQKQVASEVLQQLPFFQQQIHDAQQEDADILLADARYHRIQEVIEQCLTRQTKQNSGWSVSLDKLVLNRVLGIPIFLLIMYSLFFFAIKVGGVLQDCFDWASNAIFVDGFSQFLIYLGVPATGISLLVNGLGKGLNTVISFIPVIGMLFLFLSFLEDSGYMARAAFVLDRLMRAFGLPGKAFVPMIVGFGCNVPAVMAARTLDNKRDRILTIMMSPFMSCGARLAIYSVFTAAFFPHNGNKIVFALYLIGILMAMLTGLVLRKTLLFGQPAPLVMELPPYHLPQIRALFLHAWQRLSAFIFRAGKLIVPICVLITLLHMINLNGSINSGEGDAQSILSALGRWITPVFSPLGIHAENWPATVGLVTGILAKEVVVGTLNTLYAHGALYQHFDGKIGAFSYLLFVLLYFPCISTTAVMLREINYRWAIFSIVWMTAVAYGTAVLFYQMATVTQHAQASLLWIAGIFLGFAGLIMMIRWCVKFPVLRQAVVLE